MVELLIYGDVFPRIYIFGILSILSFQFLQNNVEVNMSVVNYLQLYRYYIYYLYAADNNFTIIFIMINRFNPLLNVVPPHAKFFHFFLVLWLVIELILNTCLISSFQLTLNRFFYRFTKLWYHCMVFAIHLLFFFTCNEPTTQPISNYILYFSA